jgi:nitroimidazol reductase NimA-like FMN-containing flavoprotein (pyridoxamine 5'-phosphate oxidase superfamily)
MQTDLTPAQCEELLAKNHYAHLGCIDDGKPYVVPITYVYKSGYIYGFSLEGHKIDVMRKNPEICVQVEHVDAADSWKSVMCWGKFEEITDAKGMQDAKLLIAGMHGQSMMKNQQPPVTPLIKNLQQKIDESVAYRMKPERMTGRAEKA